MLSLTLGLGLNAGDSSQSQGAVLFTEPLDTTGTVSNFTLAVLLEMDDPSAPAPTGFSVAAVRVAVEGALHSLYIGVQASSGDAYDAEGLTQVLFGGIASVAPDSPEDVTISDLTEFAWDGESNLIFSIYTGAVNVDVRNKPAVSYVTTYAKNGGDEASVPDKSDYATVLADTVYCVRGLTAYSA